MKRTHGKALSQCCNAKIAKEANGEWTEFTCTACGKFVDEKGKLYHYTTKDYRAP